MRIVWPRRAVRHLTALRDYIATDLEKSARDIAARILGAVERLAIQPAMGRPGRLPGTRELVIPGTPFFIPYRVREGRLELIAVIHGRRNWPAVKK
ncbi:MAG: type II toxin-antitoxin system RelE/ParE family toxin [Candidatus Solibacter usitatus]|nr:type II toxin-antitoxin system RelE/ParE family toxin [Candidatus Solibacter usitatus]